MTLKLTFLGTGTSMGIPVVGCDCRVCASGDPRDRRTRSSVYVETPEAAWVIDTGTDFRAQCLREHVRRVDAVVLTHAHTDHVMGFDDLRPFCAGGRELPVYASRETMADMRRIFTWAFDGAHRYPGYLLPVPTEVDGPFLIGETRVVPLPVEHGKAHVNGYVLERAGRRLAAYLSDVKRIPDHLFAAFEGVETLIVDGLRERPHPTHFCFDEALEVARRCGARHTWLTHLCHEAGHAETEARLPAGVRVAHDGLRLEWP